MRPLVGNDKSALGQYRSRTGKRGAVKAACHVWSGGKAAKPYLSLPERPQCNFRASVSAVAGAR